MYLCFLFMFTNDDCHSNLESDDNIRRNNRNSELVYLQLFTVTLPVIYH